MIAGSFDAPWKILAPLIVLAGSLLPAFGIWFVGHRARSKGERQSTLEALGEIPTSADPDTNARNRYLSKLAEHDRRELHHRIQIKEIGITVNRLIPEEVDPFIELKLSLWNWSVFNISDAEVDGHLSHNGQAMAGRVTKEGATNAHHGHFCRLTVRQWVTQERATELREALETGRLELDISRLRITFDVWLADADTRFQFQWSHQGTLAFTKECDWKAPPLGH